MLRGWGERCMPRGTHRGQLNKRQNQCKKERVSDHQSTDGIRYKVICPSGMLDLQ